jgi:hypothetical protein
MHTSNEQGQTGGTRRIQEKIDANGDTNGAGEFGSACSTDGVQCLGVGGEDRERPSQYRPRNPTTGGMLRQLIEDEADQLAEIDAEIERLQRRRQKSLARRDRYQAMLEELQQRIQENP